MPQGKRPYKLPYAYDNLFRLIHLLCNVRGVDTIVKLFPHEVEDLEYLIEFLENIDH